MSLWAQCVEGASIHISCVLYSKSHGDTRSKRLCCGEGWVEAWWCSVCIGCWRAGEGVRNFIKLLNR